MWASIRLGLVLLAAVLVVFVLVKLVLTLIVNLVFPVLVVIGIASLLYVLANRKALIGGRRRLLP